MSAFSSWRRGRPYGGRASTWWSDLTPLNHVVSAALLCSTGFRVRPAAYRNKSGTEVKMALCVRRAPSDSEATSLLAEGCVCWKT